MNACRGGAPRRCLVSLLTVFTTVSWFVLTAPTLTAASGPTVQVAPTTGAPGEIVTISGTGWPAGASLTAEIADATVPTIALASLGAAYFVDSAGNFSGRATVPLTLFGNGSRGNLNVVPGGYLITVGGGTTPRVQAPFTVTAPAQGTLIWGSVAFDSNSNRSRDASDSAAAGVGVTLIASGVPTARAITDAFGRYIALGLPAGDYSVASQAQYQSAPFAGTTNASAVVGQAVRADLLLMATLAQPTSPPSNRPAPSTKVVPARLPATGAGGAA